MARFAAAKLALLWGQWGQRGSTGTDAASCIGGTAAGIDFLLRLLDKKAFCTELNVVLLANKGVGYTGCCCSCWLGWGHGTRLALKSPKGDDGMLLVPEAPTAYVCVPTQTYVPCASSLTTHRSKMVCSLHEVQAAEHGPSELQQYQQRKKGIASQARTETSRQMNTTRYQSI